MSARRPEILVLQHIACEHPGVFRDLLAADGIAWRAVELDAGERIPPLGDFAALWVMGGPMDVWQESAHPWLVAEKAAIREAVVEREMPYLGVCLGHQLLADALGGEVAPGQAEIGVLPVQRAARSSPFLEGLPETFQTLQWHAAEVRRAPVGAAVLMSSPACRVQAMQVGPRALGLQYHVEITARTVAEWAAIPQYAASLEEALGAHALPGLEAAARAHMAGFNATARRLYANWKRVASF